MTDRPPDFAALWERATPWTAFLQPDMEQAELWRGVYDHAVIPDWALKAFTASPIRRLLVLSEDWCGDAANSVPVLAALADRVPGLELRILERDRYPEVMRRFLTGGSKSIPIAIALDGQFRELGHWGPRPAVLQAWVMANLKMIPSPRRYAFARRWYAKDHGESILRELLAAAGG